MGLIAKMFRFVTLRVAEGMVVIFLVAFMPNLPPYCKISDSRTITPALPLAGKSAVNDKLDNVELWHKGDLHGPEAFADYDGELYASLLSGEIVKLTGNHITPIVKFGKPCKGIYQEKICGRPLGLAFDKDGSLIAADAYYGIFRVNVKTGEKVQLVSQNVEIDGKKPKLTNSVAVASNGDIFWSDSSTEFILQDGMIDMFADGSGRLVHYNARTKENTVLIDNLMFANGVVLSADEEFVLVAETGASVIHRFYLKGTKKGTKDIFIDGLPGIPDNLNSDGKDGFFAPLIIARDEDNLLPMQFLAPWPFIRKFISRIFGLTEFGFNLVHQVYPNEYTERALHFVGHFTSFTLFLPKRVTILHLSKNGEIMQSFHTMNKRISSICEMHIFKDEAYLGSPFNDYIARVSLKELGLEGYAKKKEVPKVTSPPTLDTPPTSTTPKPTTTTQKPTTTTQKPTVKTEAPKTTTTTEKPTTTKPKTTTSKPTTTATPETKPPTTTEKPATTTEKSKTTTQKPAAATQKPTSTEKPTTTPKPTTSKPATTTTKPTTTEKPITTPPKKETPPKEEKIKAKVNSEVPAKAEVKPSTPQKETAKPESKEAKTST